MTDSSATIAAICVGVPRTFAADPAAGKYGTEWTTGIFKAPVDRARVTAYGIEGDEQADQHNHGGVDKALCAYSADHYDAWRITFGVDTLPYGAFGENLSIGGLDEGRVCIGDIWAAGDVRIQVSQPRQPCWKLERRWRRDTLINEVIAAGHTGWYFRVLAPGALTPGTRLTLVERAHPEWTITAANDAWHRRVGDVAALSALPVLSAAWRTALARRIAV